MAKNTLKVVQAIESRARTLEKFGDQVFLAGVAQGDNIHADRVGYIYPYLIISASSLDDGPPSARGIGSSRDNSKRMFVTFQVVSSDYLVTLELLQEVRDLFEGFEVEGCSQMVERMSTDFRVPGEAAMKPKRFGQGTVFSLVID